MLILWTVITYLKQQSEKKRWTSSSSSYSNYRSNRTRYYGNSGSNDIETGRYPTGSSVYDYDGGDTGGGGYESYGYYGNSRSNGVEMGRYPTESSAYVYDEGNTGGGGGGDTGGGGYDLSGASSTRDMVFFDNKNWLLTKVLLSVVGAWPFQSQQTRIVLGFSSILIILSLLIPEIFGLIKERQNSSTVIECATIMMLHVAMLVYLTHVLLNHKKMKQLLMEIEQFWNSTLLKNEICILEKLTLANRKFTHSYIWFVLVSTVLFASLPIIPKIMDIIVPLNESRPTIFIYQSEYFIDPIKYENLIFIHSYIGTMYPTIVLVGYDSLYSNLAQHSSCMFEIIRILNLLIKIFTVMIIHYHNMIMMFTSTIKSVYNIPLFFMLFLNMIAVSLAGCQVLLTSDQPSQAMRFFMNAACALIHLYFLSWVGQKISIMSVENNKLSSSSNECPYPKESPNLSLFPKQLDLLNEDNYSSTGTRTLPQVPSLIRQTPGWVDHVVNSSASSTTVGQNLNLPQRVESDEAPPPSYEQIMQPSISNIGTSPFSSNSHLQTNYSRRIISEHHNSNIENTQIGVDYVDTVNLCFGTVISMFFICVVLFAMYQLLSYR
ncbi:hypothetical protein HCN44_007544 [Aphidius gifuensis]|uniref:Odorant receptor n=2 Tax=Aphidius gifuensis TaxID=684658 RepID=A0A834XJJ7_APHGI|nr:hypothetical protein HCN44_007544 [Aphidius gifuensis]